jgi:flagellin
MGQVINTNINSLTAQRNLNKSNMAKDTAMERLSSGLRINSAKDDAAGLAISTRFDSQIRGLDQASRNANDGISLAQVGEGALSEMTNNLQRLRELAVQSSNATNSQSDRDAIQAESTQLVAEIQRIAEQTKFNGIEMFTGKFGTQAFQVGANKGEFINVSVSQMTTDRMGTAATAGVTALGNSGALDVDDLALNGISIGASTAADDTASSTQKASSAIAKVAAINRSSASTGVVAKANVNTVGGASMTGSSATTGTIVLNGTTITVNVGGASRSADRQAVVTSINAQSSLTGVTAADSGTDTGGVLLSAADGRNIDISLTTITAAQSGIDNSGSITYGGFTLTASKDIAVSRAAATGSIANTGLQITTYKTQVAQVSSRTTTTAKSMNAGDLVINGVTIGAGVNTADTASYTNKFASSIAKAAAINLVSSQTGVSAKVNENFVAGASSMSTTVTTGTITINGVATSSITSTGLESTTRAAVVSAINSISAQTGVTATDTGTTTGGVTLLAADGRNITVDYGTLTTAVTGVGASNTYYGSYTLNSAKTVTVSEGSTGSLSGNTNMSVGTYGGSSNGGFIRDINLSSVTGAQAALTAIDNALTQVSKQRSDFGALQNRLVSTINNLTTTSDNFSAANSRIKDADFAKETAQLARAQVISQAGLSMLAQANSSPQSVLSLLQG